MDRETEKIFRAFGKYVEDKEITSQEMMEEELKKFLDMYNSEAFEQEEVDAGGYLDLAYQADSVEDAIKYAEKALELDKDCLDAEVMITQLTTESGEGLKLDYEKLIAKEEKRLKEADIWKEENIGLFWGILETRSYLRLRNAYVQLLINQGKLGKAIKECEEMLLLSENDNLGVRYILMSLYALFEDEVNVNRIYKKYDNEARPQMLLPLIAYYYKVDNYKKAEAYLEKLNQANDEVVDFLFYLDDMDDFDDLGDLEIRDFIETGMHESGGKEEIMVAMAESSFLYSTTGGLLPWIAERVVPF